MYIYIVIFGEICKKGTNFFKMHFFFFFFAIWKSDQAVFEYVFTTTANHALKSSKPPTKPSRCIINIVETECVSRSCILRITIMELNVK